MPELIYDSSGDNACWIFLLVTVAMGGGAAYLSGKAIAQTWRPFWHVPLYMLPLAAAVRFCPFRAVRGAAALAEELCRGFPGGCSSPPRSATGCSAPARWRASMAGCSGGAAAQLAAHREKRLTCAGGCIIQRHPQFDVTPPHFR